ncbi:hypothetical protein ACXITP_03135 [Actinotignum sanguinis]|uniref:Uncharacterized protein n=1 Tax=Actinotignum sanguinis TaxID=1445614 RepID=A0ABT5V408_9ACTO|nr:MULTISPECIES: hypothetical protein [Actinotignum]MDE1553246.1 hypothetical protein [Actinotignum sanguinis]MDE1566108.1 hypothetical protein [Actinotignum sanguinis]MDE1577125.1 hypothetical protein [Actinotignum sanguinis]MDE1642944.1 hypothetical protein [Actinotignum sanguinis]MDE1654999.1 hypothetical protein [Actinotignum schaalii]
MGMKRIYHPEEDRQFGLVWDYDNEHSDAVYEIVFSNGECYRAVYFTAFESDNAGELDIEMDDPRYDEFHVLVFEVREIIHDGPRRYNQYLSIDYRDFPAKIIDITTNTVVYPPLP